MIRRRRQMLFGSVTGLLWFYAVTGLSSCRRHRVEVDAAPELPTSVEYGLVPWLSIESHGLAFDMPAATSWRLHSVGLVAGFLIMVIFALLARRACGWLVHNSAVTERCDRCGYPLPAAAVPPHCPECGADGMLIASPAAITIASWRRLLIAAVLALVGTATLLISALVGIWHGVRLSAGTDMPVVGVADWWRSVDFVVSPVGLAVFACAGFGFLLWLHFEPSKQRQARTPTSHAPRG